MDMSLKDVYVDIPFMAEDSISDNKSLSKGESPLVVSWLADNRNYSDSPSPSSSFRDDGALLSRKHTVPFVYVSGNPCRTASLDDLRRKNSVCDCPSRQGYRRRSHYSEYGGSFRQSRRKYSTSERRYVRKGSTRSSRSRKSSGPLERNKSVKSSESNFSRRMSNNLPPPPVKTEEDLKKERRHRIAVWLVLGAFIFIALASILVVVVTLTHRSEYVHENSTCVYYTFLKPWNFTQVRFYEKYFYL